MGRSVGQHRGRRRGKEGIKRRRLHGDGFGDNERLPAERPRAGVEALADETSTAGVQQNAAGKDRRRLDRVDRFGGVRLDRPDLQPRPLQRDGRIKKVVGIGQEPGPSMACCIAGERSARYRLATGRRDTLKRPIEHWREDNDVGTTPILGTDAIRGARGPTPKA